MIKIQLVKITKSNIEYNTKTEGDINLCST